MLTARLTFRDKAQQVCWQKQLRDKFLSEGTPNVPHLSVKQAVVRKVSRHLAEQIILQYEWLGTMAQTGYHYGIFFGSYCAGVCCYAAGGGTGGVNSHKPFGVLRQHLGVLARGACTHWAPKGTNSKLVSISAKMFLQESGCKVIIAYSDSDAGEIGTIYQACNWVCIGKGQATEQFVSPAGRVMDKKLPYDLKRRHGGTRATYTALLKEQGWTLQRSNPKWRYAFAIDEQIRQRLAQMRVAYPKRATSIDSDASAVQAEEGGAGPTVALSYDVIP